MAFSLEELTDSLKLKTGDPYAKFTNTQQTFFNEGEMKLIARKRFHLYERIDEHAKLTYKGLPPKEAFYSKVKLDGISDEDYEHSQNVYNTFKCKDFGDYHCLYLKTGVLLLANIFGNFRKMSSECYKLDPANYLTAASLAWDAALLKTEIELELITNQEIQP